MPQFIGTANPALVAQARSFLNQVLSRLFYCLQGTVFSLCLSFLSCQRALLAWCGHLGRVCFSFVYHTVNVPRYAAQVQLETSRAEARWPSQDSTFCLD